MSGLDVDGSRPAAALVTALPRAYRLTQAERHVLLVLACDSFDGRTSAPGMDALAGWTGLARSTAYKVVESLSAPTDRRPALLAREEESRGRNRTVFRLLLEPSELTGRFEDAEPSEVRGRLGEPEHVQNSPQPSGQPSAEPSGQPSVLLGPHPSLPSQNPPTPHALPSVAEASAWAGEECDARRPRGPHVLDANGLACVECLQRNPEIADSDRDVIYARTKLEDLHRRLALPLDVDDLLEHAERLGGGDLVAGVRAVERATERTLDGAQHPKAVLLARLRSSRATNHRPIPKRPERQAS